MYPATSSIHVPWFRHGLDAHSLMLVWQLGPGEGGTAVSVAVTLGAVARSHLVWRKGPALSLGPGVNPSRSAPPPGKEPPRVAVAGPVSWLRAAALGGPLCTRSPAPLTTEAFPAGAHVAAGHVLAGAPVDTGVRLTLVVVDVTVCPTPPGVTVTLVPAEVTTRHLRLWPKRGGPRLGALPALPPSYDLIGRRRRSALTLGVL